jgi:hypothetical protein
LVGGLSLEPPKARRTISAEAGRESAEAAHRAPLLLPAPPASLQSQRHAFSAVSMFSARATAAVSGAYVVASRRDMTKERIARFARLLVL